MKTAIYIRVSTDDQHVNAQYNEIIRTIPSTGYYSVYNDSGVSGTTANRKELQRLFKDIEEGRINKVIVYKMDRLFRSLKDLINTLTLWDQKGVVFVSVKDNVDLSTPTGRLMMHLLGAFAEFEASLIRERVKAGMKNAKQNGTRSGKPIGRAPTDLNVESLKSLQRNLSYRGIAKATGVPKSVVYRALNKKN